MNKYDVRELHVWRNPHDYFTGRPPLSFEGFDEKHRRYESGNVMHLEGVPHMLSVVGYGDPEAEWYHSLRMMLISLADGNRWLDRFEITGPDLKLSADQVNRLIGGR